MSLNTPPKSMSSIRTAAIALLFKDGFSMQDLSEIFTLSPDNIEEHVRRAMFNGNGVSQMGTIHPASPASVKQLPEPVAATPPLQRKAAKKRAVAPGLQTVASKAEKRCEKHPDSGFYKNGQCRQCALDYQKDHWKKKQAAKTGNVPRVIQKRKERPRLPELPIEETFEPDEIDEERTIEEKNPVVTTKPEVEFVYSEPLSCPKCGDRNVRLRRRKDADALKDYWLDVKPNGAAPCMLKMINYNIKSDLSYVAD